MRIFSLKVLHLSRFLTAVGLFGLSQILVPSASANDDCRSLFANNMDRLILHKAITHRGFSELTQRLNELNNRQTLSGVKGPLPSFEMSKFTDGHGRLLSLGEGVSDFVFQILSKRRDNRLPPDGVVADDILYSDPNRYMSEFATSVGLSPGEASAKVRELLHMLQLMMSAFPDNYFGVPFQDLTSARFIDSSEQKFDEIVSSHSFNRVLAAGDLSKPEQRNRDLALLKQTIGLLSDGGVFRIIPGFSTKYELERWHYAKSLLDQLMSEGYIRNHNMQSPVMPSDLANAAIIIQK